MCLNKIVAASDLFDKFTQSIKVHSSIELQLLSVIILLRVQTFKQGDSRVDRKQTAASFNNFFGKMRDSF